MAALIVSGGAEFRGLSSADGGATGSGSFVISVVACLGVETGSCMFLIKSPVGGRVAA